MKRKAECLEPIPTADSVITYTLCESGENHVGMQTLGEAADQGFSLEDLQGAAGAAERLGCTAELVDLRTFAPRPSEAPAAYVLIVRGFLGALFAGQGAEGANSQAFSSLRANVWDTMYWDSRRRRVLNKRARYNNVVAHFRQKADFDAGKGTVLAFEDVPALAEVLRCVRERFGGAFGRLCIAEGNLYPDGGAQHHGIGYHGDAERRLVVGVRFAAKDGPSMPLHFQWFHKSRRVGKECMIRLDAGDLYVMSEKAVGSDWKKSSILTLRHATGARKYTGS